MSDFATSAKQHRATIPVYRLYGNFLLDKLAAFLEDKMTPLRPAPLTGTQSRNEHALGIRQKRIGQGFL